MRELTTVRFEGYSSPVGITENQLHRELKLPARVSYDNNPFQSLKTETEIL